MPIPSQKEIAIPLLHLIQSLGGEVKPTDVYDELAGYFKLTENEIQEMHPSGYDRIFENRVRWAREKLCQQGFLERSIRGIWKITEKGRKQLARLGLIDKPFPAKYPQGSKITSPPKSRKESKSKDEEILDLILKEIAPDGPKQFPEDFLDNKCSDFYEICLPGTQLYLAPLSKVTITSPKGYFRYQAKKPSEAKYILYCHKLGLKKINVPSDNLTLFKVVKAYERYCDELTRRAFRFFLEFTNDEYKAEELTKEITRKLELRGKLLE